MNKTVIINLLLVLVVSAAYSQEDKTKKDSNKELSTTLFEKIDYRPTVSDAKKLTETPSIIDTTLPKPAPQYLYGNEPVKTEFKPDSIEAATMKGEPLDPLYRAYTRGGVGNGINYLGDLYVNALRSRDGAVGLELHGRGAQGVFTDLPAAPYNRWNGVLSGKRFLKKHALDFSLGYDRERLQYYGYDLSDNQSLAMYNELIDQNLGDDNAIRNQFKQYYQRIDAGAGLKSFYTDSTSLNHQISINYNRWSDRNGANSEHNILLNGDVSRYFGDHRLSVGVLGDMNLVNYSDSFIYQPTGLIDQQPLNIIAGVKPIMVSTWKKLRIEYGANIQVEITETGTTPRIYPHAYGKYNLVKDVIIPYAGITGGLKRNNLNNFSEENPFIWAGRTALKNTDEVIRFYGGFRGAISDQLTYNIQAAKYFERDAPLYVNYNASQYNQGKSRFGENYFIVNYDTLEVFQISGELMYRVADKLQVVGSGSYRSYQTTVEFEAWQRPAIEAGLTGFYQLKNKIIAKAQIHFIGPQWIKSYETSAEEFFGNDGLEVRGNQLNPIVDVNLGVEYRYTERLSGFLNLNNVIAQRYQRWNQYPSQRFNILGGVTYSFWKE
jgi:hypothetical protein